MNKIKNALYAIFSVVLAAAPVMARAQWDAGNAAGSGSGLTNTSVSGVLGTLIDGLLAIVGFLGIIGFIISGILYLTAAGDEDQIGKAKTAMVYSIVGIIVALIGWIVINAISTWLVNDSAGF